MREKPARTAPFQSFGLLRQSQGVFTKRSWRDIRSALRNKDSFLHQFTVTLSGSSVVTLLGLLASPINTRLYGPEAYGTFSVFSVLLTNLSLLSTLNYPGAVLLPKTKFRFELLLQLCLVLTVAVTLLVVAGLVFFSGTLQRFFKLEALGNWIYLLPVMLLATNLFGLLNAWFVRNGRFQGRARIDVGTSVLSRGFTVGYPFVAGSSPLGFVFGDLIGRVTGILLSAKVLAKDLTSGGLFRLRMQRLYAIAREYRKFPLYSLPSTYINVFSSQLPVLVLNRHFAATAVGWYAFTMSILELPINLLANSIGLVFLRKAVAAHHDQGLAGLRQVTESFFLRIFLVGLLPFSVLSVFGDWIFTFAFGAAWTKAGSFAAYLGIYFVLRVIYVVLVGLYPVIKRQQVDLLLNIGLLALRLAAVTIGVRANSIDLAVGLFAAVSTVGTAVNIFVLLRYLGVPVAPLVWRCGSAVAVAGGVLVGLRLLLVRWFQ